MQALRIDVWSDIACPWCYVGKRRLEAALEQFPRRDAVELVWHSFELDPSAPRTSDAAPYAGRLARKYGASVADAFAAAVRDDEDRARRLGIRGVPYFVFNGTHSVSGAHPSDTFLAALQLAWDTANARVIESPEASSCGPDGCA